MKILIVALLIAIFCMVAVAPAAALDCDAPTFNTDVWIDGDYPLGNVHETCFDLYIDKNSAAPIANFYGSGKSWCRLPRTVCQHKIRCSHG